MTSIIAASYFEFFTGDFLVFGVIAAVVWGFQKNKEEEFFNK